MQTKFKIQTFNIVDYTKVSQYRICQIIPTICGVNGVAMNYDIVQETESPNCSCSQKKQKRLPSISTGLLARDRIRSYSQIIQKPTTKIQRCQTVVKDIEAPKFLSLRVSARRWCLFDRKQKEVNFNSNDDEKCEVGCLTKLMAIYTLFDVLKNEQLRVTVPSFAENLPEPKADLNAFNQLSFIELLHAVIMRSGNDAIWALVMACGQSFNLTQRKDIKNRFISLMNENAQKLKMNNTRYVNFDGLDDPNNVSTANDLAVLCNELLNINSFKKIIKKSLFKCRATTEQGIQSTTYSWKSRTTKYLKRNWAGIMAGSNQSSGSCVALYSEALEKIIILLRATPKQEIKDADLIIKY